MRLPGAAAGAAQHLGHALGHLQRPALVVHGALGKTPGERDGLDQVDRQTAGEMGQQRAAGAGQVDELAQPIAFDRRTVADDETRLLQALVDQERLQRRVVLEVALLLAALDPVERRLGDVEMTLLDDVGEVAVEEGQQERADMRAVDVGVGHDDDLVVAQLAEVEIVADAGAQGGDQRADLLAAQHPVEPGALDVEDLAAQGQDRLHAAVAALLGRAAGAVTLDDEQLGLGRVALLAVGELARQVGDVERPLAAGSSRARRAASRAVAASTTLPMIVLASTGWSRTSAPCPRR